MSGMYELQCHYFRIQHRPQGIICNFGIYGRYYEAVWSPQEGYLHLHSSLRVSLIVATYTSLHQIAGWWQRVVRGCFRVPNVHRPPSPSSWPSDAWPIVRYNTRPGVSSHRQNVRPSKCVSTLRGSSERAITAMDDILLVRYDFRHFSNPSTLEWYILLFYISIKSLSLWAYKQHKTSEYIQPKIMMLHNFAALDHIVGAVLGYKAGWKGHGN